MTTPYSNAIELSKTNPNEVINKGFLDFVKDFNKGRYPTDTAASARLASDAMDSISQGKTPELPKIKTLNGLKIKSN